MPDNMPIRGVKERGLSTGDRNPLREERSIREKMYYKGDIR